MARMHITIFAQSLLTIPLRGLGVFTAVNYGQRAFRLLWQVRHPLGGAITWAAWGRVFAKTNIPCIKTFFCILIGGSTTVTMRACFFYLPRNSSCYATVANEMRSTFSSIGEIHSGPQLNNCKYLRAYIDETLCMSPPSLASL